MKNNLDSLKSKINSLPAEFLEMISNYFENLEPKKNSGICNYQIDEVKERLEFHRENPKSRLDFFENIKELEHYLYASL
jgi:hypothetical protein